MHLVVVGGKFGGAGLVVDGIAGDDQVFGVGAEDAQQGVGVVGLGRVVDGFAGVILAGEILGRRRNGFGAGLGAAFAAASAGDGRDCDQ